MSIAEDLVAARKPWIRSQDEIDFLEVIGSQFVEFETYATGELDDPSPGWGIMWDVDNAPVKGLPWLAQFAGERLAVGIAEDDARRQIRDAPNQIRGTKNGIARAAQRHLTGHKTVMMHPRMKLDGTVDVDWLAMITLAGETPDPTQTRQDILGNMPADIQLDYESVTEAIWAEVASEWATWADVAADNATWADVAQVTARTGGGWLVWTV